MSPAQKRTFAVDIAKVHKRVRTGEARDIRVSCALSLQNIASVVGVTPAAVHSWENGKYLPRGENAVRYERLLSDLEKERS